MALHPPLYPPRPDAEIRRIAAAIARALRRRRPPDDPRRDILSAAHELPPADPYYTPHDDPDFEGLRGYAPFDVLFEPTG